ncbi:major facilitator superfamily domain-containing protein [Aspergillus lucknowensis]|uniref:Major facilitator superfamily domain-containing protein n=1 Tax=Aspergillus lucknowensis TaxID=176173 RepID=A0ABR4LDS5_9EURO
MRDEHIQLRHRIEYDWDAVATQLSIWDSENVEEYKRLYIHPEWENRRAFDPNFRWTWREERAVRRKVDLKIMLWVCIMFTALNIDRGNISNAMSDNMLDDLGLRPADYNTGQTIARVVFLVAELPSQIISKRIGPDMWIPIQICIFSLISALQFFLKRRASFLATRYLIATFQGGFIPDTILYLSYFYTGPALPIRLAWYWMSSQVADIGVGFAAVGLLSMRGVGGYAGWRWLFLIEGLFTFLIGVASFFLVPQSPAKTETRWNPKGYFTEKEEKIIVNSVICDDPQKGGMHNRQGLSVRQIWKGIKDYNMLPLYALGLLFGLANELVNNRSFVSMALLVICIWMCVIQYPATYFYYRWRNNSKAQKWDAMSPEEQHHYRQTTTDKGNKRLDFRFAT